MKKLIFPILSLALLASCGGNKSGKSSDDQNPEEQVLTPESATVSGDLSENYTVVERNYKPVKDFGTVLTVEIVRTEAPLPFDPNEEISGFSTSQTGNKVGFGIEFIDDDGNILDKNEARSTHVYDHTESVNLAKLKPGDKGTIRFSMHGADKATKFRITSAYDNIPESGSSSSSSSYYDSSDDSEVGYSSSSSGSVSAEFEAAMKDYEAAFKAYSDVLKKMKNGDVTAIANMATYASKLQSSMDKLSSYKGELSAAEMKRFNEAIQKGQQVMFEAMQ